MEAPVFLLWGLRVLLGSMFFLSGLAKWPERKALPEIVADYDLLPEALVGPVARLLLVSELAIGGALLSGLLPAWSSGAAMILSGVLALAAFINLRRGRSIQCGCFGASSTEKVSGSTVVRASSLALASGVCLVALIVAGKGVSSADLRPGAVVAVYAVGSTMALLYLVLFEAHRVAKTGNELREAMVLGVQYRAQRNSRSVLR